MDDDARYEVMVTAVGSVRAYTKGAVLVEFGGFEVWLPLSQVQVDEGTVTLPQWLADKHGIDGEISLQ